MAMRMAAAGRFGVVVALVAAVIAIPVPVAAAPVPATISISPRTLSLHPGQTASITVTLTNGTGAPPDSVAATDMLYLNAAVAGSGGANGGHNTILLLGASPWPTVHVTFDSPGQSEKITFQLQELAAPFDLPAGTVQDNNQSAFTLTEWENTMDPVSGHFDVKLYGPPAPASHIDGSVADTSGRPVAGAHVAVKDSTGHTFTTTSGSSGAYALTSDGSSTVAAGKVTVTASKTGYVTATKSGGTFVPGHDLAAGSITLKAVPAATTSATAPPSAGPSATRSASPIQTTAPSGVASAPAVTPPSMRPAAATATSGAQRPAGDSDTAGLLWAIVVVAAVVVFGAGALLLRRRGGASR